MSIQGELPALQDPTDQHDLLACPQASRINATGLPPDLKWGSGWMLIRSAFEGCQDQESSSKLGNLKEGTSSLHEHNHEFDQRCQMYDVF